MDEIEERMDLLEENDRGRTPLIRPVQQTGRLCPRLGYEVAERS